MMSIYIPTIDDKANGIPSSHKLGLNIFRDFGFTDRDYYQFSIYLAEEIKNHNARLIYVTPQGSVFKQQMAAEFAK